MQMRNVYTLSQKKGDTILIHHSREFRNNRQTAVKQEMTNLSDIINKQSHCILYNVLIIKFLCLILFN